MTNPIHGRCHCGKNTYSVTGDPEFQFICYCENCRVLNSGGHLCGIIFDKASLNEAEHTQQYHYPGGSGNPIIMHFCPHCSTQLYAFPKEHNSNVVIRANTVLDSEFEPQHHIFTESAFDWDKTGCSTS